MEISVKNFCQMVLVFFFGTENRNWIELYHLQNTCKFFTFSEHEARHCKIVKSTNLKGVPSWFECTKEPGVWVNRIGGREVRKIEELSSPPKLSPTP